MTSSSAPSRKALSKIACNRLQKELTEWQLNPPTGFRHKVTDNLQKWTIDVTGAPGTLYANETYQLQVEFPVNYPMEAPQACHLDPLGFLVLFLFDICNSESDRKCLFDGVSVINFICCWLSRLFLFLRHRHTHIFTAMDIFVWNLPSLKIALVITDHPRLDQLYDILYDSWSPAMTVSSVCISILSMLSSSPAKERPADNDRYVKNCKNGRSPKETRWWFHDDKA
ncbi:hypothetical protein HID58_066875 [Brassica napus]|uniref:UBC core domain-containing protein n=1 Tax=Brassica napus TaxID=3708 RepID=A0ABQ7ZGZ7_BRANA|nr:hypothetical protein HID58_066875 [Brassica napus]